MSGDAKATGYAAMGCGALILGLFAVLLFWPGVIGGILIILIGAALAFGSDASGQKADGGAAPTTQAQAAQVEEPAVRCPRCKSTQVQAFRKGFRAGRAAAGWIVAGPVGALVGGALGSGKVELVCLKCGKRFRPGG